MKKKIFYTALSLGFFVILLVGMVMFSDLFFNSSSSFFDRMSEATQIFKGLSN